MSTDTQHTGKLVLDDESAYQNAANVAVALGIATFAFGWAALFEWVEIDSSLAGLPVVDIFGVLLVVLGLATLGLGLVSRAEMADTTPDTTAGLIPGIAFGGTGFVLGGLVASQLLGLGTIGWFLAAVVAGAVVLAVTVLPREDIGSTLVPGLLIAGFGLVFLTDTMTVAWEFRPSDFSASATGTVFIPLLSAFAGLFAAWSSGKASEGFGTRGRQRGAYMLVSTVVAAMLAVLLLLIAFIVQKGLGTVGTGVEVGLGVGPSVGIPIITDITGTSLVLPIDIPFVMNAAPLGVVVPGILPAVLGTLWLIVGAIALAVPLGVGAAIFLTEYAEQGRFTDSIEITTNGLWSTPSIVYGLFGAAFLVPRFGNSKSLISGMLVLGFMLLPLVVITSRESLKAVPDEYRDASAALGVSQWQTIRSVVLPAAMPGVITGIILGVGRIAGETAPLLLVTGGKPFPSQKTSILSGFEFTTSPPFVTNEALMQASSALPYQLYTTITAGQAPGTQFTQSQFGWGTALVLLVVVLSLYAIGVASRIYFRRKLNHE
ncbi:phosphate ABC transporter permease PstA [Haloarchaeobius sp. DFWS5]|uniref:phosphate ABC transporter permease PstA n=1 Tax=Haloarchaeobius sp. DFWS5 TaxID=3446114 RepID=UPI003EBDDD9E